MANVKSFSGSGNVLYTVPTGYVAKVFLSAKSNSNFSISVGRTSIEARTSFVGELPLVAGEEIRANSYDNYVSGIVILEPITP